MKKPCAEKIDSYSSLQRENQQHDIEIDLSQFQDGKLRLEIFNDTHIDALSAKAQDARIWKHHGEHFEDPNIYQSIRLEKAKKDIAKKSRYKFVIFLENEIIGATSYYDINLKHLTMKIGYTWLHPNYWGQGINLKIKKMLLAYAFDILKFRRVAFMIDSKNQPSRSAIEKLGIPFEGILKNHMIRPDLTQRDSAVYAITCKDWQEKNIQ